MEAITMLSKLYGSRGASRGAGGLKPPTLSQAMDTSLSPNYLREERKKKRRKKRE